MDSFKHTTNAALYRLEYTFPPPKGSLNLSGITKPIVSTNKGVYTNSQSALYTEKIKL